MILIVNGDPNTVIDKKARTKIDEINAMFTYSCQVFNLEDLVFDITKHDLVPKHCLIDDEQKKVLYKMIIFTEFNQALLEKYRLNEA